MNKENIIKYLEVIKKAVSFIEEELNDVKDSSGVELIKEPKKVSSGRYSYINDILNHPNWPEAIPSHVICKPTEEDQENRANAVLQAMIDCDLNDLNFLDYGCGDGWITNQAIQLNVRSSTGYDINSSEIWDKFPRAIFTTNKNDLKQSFYDVIFLYDVLDHCMDAESVMNHVYELLSDKGIVYIRCHPWTSKHGSHLPKKGLNKAYVHLFLTEQEIVKHGHEITFTRMETKPLEAYKWWFRNFNVNLERFHRQDLHPFFKNPTFQNHMFLEQKIESKDQKEFIKNLEIDFIDYVLTKK